MLVRDAKREDLATVRQIAAKDVRILWCDDFWDGPLSGVAEVEYRRVLYDIVDTSAMKADEDRRQFWLIELSPQQLAEEERWHELFCQNVGTHFDCTERERTAPAASCHHKFYDAYQKRTLPNYGENQVLGWFEL